MQLLIMDARKGGLFLVGPRPDVLGGRQLEVSHLNLWQMRSSEDQKVQWQGELEVGLHSSRIVSSCIKLLVVRLTFPADLC